MTNKVSHVQKADSTGVDAPARASAGRPASPTVKRSAGLLLYRFRNAAPEALLVHPGGPFWANKDAGAWSIPKGMPLPDEDLLDTAQRELREETGLAVTGPFRPLEPVRQPGGKIVHAWAAQGDADVSAVRSNLFSMEWPPRSGQIRQFAEVDRAAWFGLSVARQKVTKGQIGLIDQLQCILAD